MVKKTLNCVLLNNKNKIGNEGKVMKFPLGYIKNYLFKNNKALVISKDSNPNEIAKIKILSLINKDLENIKDVKNIVFEKKVNTSGFLYEIIYSKKIMSYITNKVKINNSHLFNIKIENVKNNEIKMIGDYKANVFQKGKQIHEINIQVIKLN